MSKESPAAAALRAELIEFAKASNVLNDKQLQRCAKLGEGLKALLRIKALRIIAESVHDPILFSYCADATSVACGVNATGKLGGKAVVRNGEETIEFLMERGAIKSLDPSGLEKAAIIVCDARP